MSAERELLGYIQTQFDLETSEEPRNEPIKLRRLHEALEPYLNVQHLRQLIIEQANLRESLRSEQPPEEICILIEALSALLRPRPNEQIRSPTDAAAMLMIEMRYLDQEELRTILLDTKNRVQDLVTIYRGSLNASLIRVGEVYKSAIRRNSAAIIVAHNHPSGDPTPSPEDVLVTRQIVEAGKLLDIDCLDHLVIGQSSYVSMRERGLGFII